MTNKIDKKTLTFLQESNLIEGVSDDASLEQAIQAWIYLEQQKSLNLDVILTAHAILMANQDIPEKDKGALRQDLVIVGWRDCPNPKHLPQLMKHWVHEYANKASNSTEIKTAHIQFELIHPFIDGNGRIGRMIMNWQRIRISLPIIVISANDRQNYYRWFIDYE